MPDTAATEAELTKLALLQQDITQQLNLAEPDVTLTMTQMTEYRQLLLSISDNVQSAELVQQHLAWLNQQVDLVIALKAELMTEISQLNRAKKANTSYDNHK